MVREILIFLLFSQLLSGCIAEGSKQQYQYIGQVGFRRSYAGHENVSDAEMDAIERSNPIVMSPMNSEEDAMLRILTHFRIADKNRLLLDRIAQTLKDSIYISVKNSQNDTVYINYSNTKETGAAFIKIRNRAIIDSIPIRDQVFSHTFYLLKLNDTTRKLFVFVNQYYIMNGDNYEVSVYEKK